MIPVRPSSCFERDRKLGADFPPGAASAFGASVGSWPPFRDSSLALAKLKDLGLSLVVLSNVDNASFAQYVQLHAPRRTRFKEIEGLRRLQGDGMLILCKDAETSGSRLGV
jgi:hypothetical protein